MLARMFCSGVEKLALTKRRAKIDAQPAFPSDRIG
jgi:hypothetical protein